MQPQAVQIWNTKDIDKGREDFEKLFVLHSVSEFKLNIFWSQIFKNNSKNHHKNRQFTN